MQIFFILGSHHLLSIADITAVLTMRQITWKSIASSDEVLIIDVPKDAAIDIAWFGGVVKWGRMIEEQEVNPTVLGSDFGVSVYQGDSHVSAEQLVEQWKRAQKFGMELKRSAKHTGHVTRFVTSKQRALSSVIVEKEIFRHDGDEFVWIVLPDRILFGKTVAVQAFEEYGARDYGRPGSDARSGMLPPKVAKMMVNLACATKGGTILDPFCGSGTILQEALLLGYNCIGSDKSPSAVKDAKKNLDWLESHYSITQLPHYDIFQSDVRTLSQHVTRESIDAIVTEPYLGPALRMIPSEDKLKPVLQELTQFYVDACEVFSRIVKPGGRVVFIFPVFIPTIGSIAKVKPGLKHIPEFFLP